MKTVSLRTIIGCLSVVLAACGTDPLETPAVQQAAGALTCPAGQIPVKLYAGTGLASAEGQNLGLVPPPKKPNKALHISRAFCNGVETLTDAVQEYCEGRGFCSYQVEDCKGSAQISYQCGSDDPRYQYCKEAKNCYFQINCSEPVATTTAPALERCVPEKCHGSSKRDSNYDCVVDPARPIEYRKAGYDEYKGQDVPETRAYVVLQPTLPQYKPFRVVEDLNLPPGVDRVSWGDAAWYRVFFVESPYTMTLFYDYVEPRGVTAPPKGVLTLYAYDTYKNGHRALRCQVHQIDLSKYSGAFALSTFHRRLTLEETFVLPRDCTDGSGTASENAAGLARKLGYSRTLDFINANPPQGVFLAASYSPNNEVFFLDDDRAETKKTSCAANPSDFFYDPKMLLVDRVAHLEQRRIPLVLAKNASGNFVGDVYGDTRVFFHPTMMTNIGVKSVTPKRLTQKISTVGAARGFIRTDVEYYIAGDRHKYWQNNGFASEDKENWLNLTGYLLPLDENQKPIPAGSDGYPTLGTVRVYTSSGNGSTYSANYPITETLRQTFQDPKSKLYTTKEGRLFLLRSCFNLGTLGTPEYRYGGGGQYLVRFDNDTRCVDAKAPLRIRLDNAIAPFDPVQSDPFSDAQPAAAGDSKMTQNFDNDSESNCNTTAGTCTSTMDQELFGLGLLGRTTVESHVEATDSQMTTGGAKPEVERKVELMGFNVLDGEEEAQEDVSGPQPKFSFKIAPPFDELKTRFNMSSPPRVKWEVEYMYGQKGLGIGWSLNIPVRYGPVQGEIVMAFSVAFGVSLELNFEYLGKKDAVCTGSQEDCDSQYTLLPAQPFGDALKSCYALGGRLADLRRGPEAKQLLTRVSQTAGKRLWVGAQLANEYATPACRNTWVESCKTNHFKYMRWLADDEDFVSSTSFAAFTLEKNTDGSTDIVSDAGVIGYDPLSVAMPKFEAVTLSDANRLTPTAITDRYPALCRYQDFVSGHGWKLEALVSFTFEVGVEMGFCTPSEEFGVCLIGSISFLTAELKPGFSYKQYHLKNKANKTGIQSGITFNIPFKLSLLGGAIDVKVNLGKWFSFKYTLLEFSGFSVPVETELYKKEWSIFEDFK